MQAPAPNPRTACHVCGAPYGDRAPLYCRSCRAKQAVGVADLDAYRDDPERFELVRAHPAYAEAARWRPRLRPGGELVQPIVIWVVATAWSVGVAAVAWSAGASREMKVAFTAVAAVIVLVATRLVITAARRLYAPGEQVIAVIAEDVARPDRGGDPTGVANHRVTLRTADGKTREVLATEAQMGLVALADIGVAYLQGKRLAAFRRFDVMPAPLATGELPPPPACEACAAPYTFASRTHCAYCGAALAHPDLGEHGARFAKVLADPETAADRTRAIVPALPSITGAVVALALAGLIVYGLWIFRFLWFFLAEEWPWGLLILVPLVGIVLVAAIYGRRRLAPRLARRADEIALVVRTREDAWAEVNGRPVIDYHVTLAGPGGGRIEKRVMPAVVRRIEVGAIGVAHLKGDWLAAWTPLSAA